MHTTANIKVNETVSRTETDLMSLIWKRLEDGEVIITVQPSPERDSKTTIPVSVDDKSAGWLRSSPMPGL